MIILGINLLRGKYLSNFDHEHWERINKGAINTTDSELIFGGVRVTQRQLFRSYISSTESLRKILTTTKSYCHVTRKPAAGFRRNKTNQIMADDRICI